MQFDARLVIRADAADLRAHGRGVKITSATDGRSRVGAAGCGASAAPWRSNAISAAPSPALDIGSGLIRILIDQN